MYLIDHLKFGDTLSYGISGAYVTLVYLSPILGGIIADKMLGYKKSVVYGALLMSTGHIILGIGGDSLLYTGMAFIICGYGFFKTNIACLLGQQYDSHDPKKDSAFTLFYLGGNIGGIFAPMLCGIVAHYYGWHYGFGLAGIGMVFGLIVFIFGSKHIGDIPSETITSKASHKLILPLSMLLMIVVSYFTLEFQSDGYLLAIVISMAMLFFIFIVIKTDFETRKSLLILIPFFIFGVMFWIFDEQLYTSVEIFIHRNVDTYFYGIDIPASTLTSLNAVAILFGGLVVAWVWRRVKSLDNDFGKMIKFSFGFIFQLLCFTLFFIAAKQASVTGTTSLPIIVVALLFLGMSELFIDPIAMSEITSIKDKKHTGFLVAFYMLSTGSVAGFIGAKVANIASFKDVSGHINLIEQAHLFEGLFSNIVLIIIGVITAWFVLAMFVKKMK